MSIESIMTALGYVIANWIGYGSSFSKTSFQWRFPLAMQTFASDPALTQKSYYEQRPAGQAPPRPLSNPQTNTPALPAPSPLQSYSSTSTQSNSSKTSSNPRSRSPTRYHDPEPSAAAASQERFRVANYGPEAPDINLPPINRSNASVREEGPSPLHRPRRLIMPAPLQTIPANVSVSGPQTARANSFHSSPSSTQSRANHIPIRESKGRNLLRKRSTIGNEVITRQEQAPPTTYFNEPEAEKESKFSRKLSKRKF